MDNNDLNKSLFLRTLHNVYDLMDRLCLEPDESNVRLSKYNETELKEGVARFRDALVLISDNSRYKTGYGYNIPFIVYKEGNA